MSHNAPLRDSFLGSTHPRGRVQLAELAADTQTQVAAVRVISSTSVTIGVQHPVRTGTFIRLRAKDCLVLGHVLACETGIAGCRLRVHVDELIPFRRPVERITESPSVRTRLQEAVPVPALAGVGAP